MHQPSVGEFGQPIDGVVVGEADRLAAKVSRRHDEALRAGVVAPQPEEQHVQRRVAQHHAEIGVVRGHRVGDGGIGSAGQQHDRALHARQCACRCVVHLGHRPRRVEVGHHHCERLVATALASAQFGDGELVGRVARQVIAADALEREYAAVAQQLSGLLQPVRAVGEPSVVRPVAQRRPAVGAAHRLGVEAAVGGVGVLAGTVVAHGEAGHRRGGAIVGQRADDGEPGPAVGAVDERVPVAPVGRVAQFGRAVRAHRDVG